MLSCKSCSLIGNSLNVDFRSKESVEWQVNLTRSAVCEQLTPELKEGCYAFYPEFWTKLSNALFLPDYGWWSPHYLCQDLCPKGRKVLSKDRISCTDCEERISISYSYMQKPDILAKIVSDFKKYKYCQLSYPENIEFCNLGLEIAIPTALPLIGQQTAWIPVFCQEDIKCEK